MALRDRLWKLLHALTGCRIAAVAREQCLFAHGDAVCGQLRYHCTFVDEEAIAHAADVMLLCYRDLPMEFRLPGLLFFANTKIRPRQRVLEVQSQWLTTSTCTACVYLRERRQRGP